MELNEKLTRFATTLLEETMEEHRGLLRDMELMYTEKTETYENMLKEKYADELKKSKIKISEMHNQIALSENMKTKQEFMKLRDKFTNKVFDKVRDKLIEFTKSDEYKDYLIKCTESAKELLNSDDITIHILERDCRFKPDLEKMGVAVAYTNSALEDFIGGITATATDRNFIVNLSMGEKMLSERERFSF